MDVKIKEYSDYKNCIYFLIEVSFHSNKYFIEQIYAKSLFGQLNTCHFSY